jgi:hypothetical protein
MAILSSWRTGFALDPARTRAYKGNNENLQNNSRLGCLGSGSLTREETVKRTAAIRVVWVLTLGLLALPGFGQEVDEVASREAGASFSYGNMFVQSLIESNDPVRQLKLHFESAALPLTRDQEKRLAAIVAAQQKHLAAILDGAAPGERSAEVRKLNLGYMKQANDVLTAAQQSEWRHYRVEQIRLRGGFPALQYLLDDAKVPLTEEQKASIETIYKNFDQRRAALTANATPDNEKLDNLFLAEFHRVSTMLTPEQRKALLATRPTRTASRTKP